MWSHAVPGKASVSAAPAFARAVGFGAASCGTAPRTHRETTSARVAANERTWRDIDISYGWRADELEGSGTTTRPTPFSSTMRVPNGAERVETFSRMCFA